MGFVLAEGSLTGGRPWSQISRRTQRRCHYPSKNNSSCQIHPHCDQPDHAGERQEFQQRRTAVCKTDPYGRVCQLRDPDELCTAEGIPNPAGQVQGQRGICGQDGP